MMFIYINFRTILSIFTTKIFYISLFLTCQTYCSWQEFLAHTTYPLTYKSITVCIHIFCWCDMHCWWQLYSMQWNITNFIPFIHYWCYSCSNHPITNHLLTQMEFFLFVLIIFLYKTLIYIPITGHYHN